MKLEEKNGVYMILCDEDETFWAFQVIDRKMTHRPLLKRELRDWWENTAPGGFTTTYTSDRKKAILISDKSLFMLFKLAWQGTPEIYRPTVIESAAFYCPYIPLQITNAGGSNTPPPITFKTNIRVYKDPFSE